MNNSDTIIKFYQAFARNDAEGMIKCYHKEIEFQDPAFGLLKNDEVKNMWRMLLSSNTGELIITVDNVRADENNGSADWKAQYVFSPTGRHVINHVSAKFEFKNGKIIRHTDDFDLWKWTRQAFGWRGYLLGWSSFMKNKIRQKTRIQLKRFMEGGDE